MSVGVLSSGGAADEALRRAELSSPGSLENRIAGLVAIIYVMISILVIKVKYQLTNQIIVTIHKKNDLWLVKKWGRGKKCRSFHVNSTRREPWTRWENHDSLADDGLASRGTFFWFRWG